MEILQLKSHLAKVGSRHIVIVGDTL